MAEPLPLVLTRPRAQAEAFAAEIAARLPGRFRPLIAPVLEITPLPGAVDLAGIAALLFTSANGVAQFAAREPRRDLTAFCVGEITAEAARGAGMRAVSADGDVVALAALVIARQRPEAGPLLHIRGRHAAGDLAGALAAAGFSTRAAEIYDQRPCRIGGAPAALLAAGTPAVVAHFSLRSARLFAAQATEDAWPLAAITSVALSPAADAALAGLAFARRLVAAAPTREGMIEALERA